MDSPNYTYGFPAPKIIGDTMYNCSPVEAGEEGEAEIGTGVSDSRAETTSLSASILVEISLGIIGLADSTAEFKAFAGKSSKIETTVKVTQATTVAPGFKGYNLASLRSGYLSGSAYVTDGPNLIQVKGIELTFPGFRESDATQPVKYRSHTEAMTSDEQDTYCKVAGGTGSAARAARTTTQAGGPAQWQQRFEIAVCRLAERGRLRCTKRTFTGLRPPRTHRLGVTATRTRAGPRLRCGERPRRSDPARSSAGLSHPGPYKLTIAKKPKRIIVRDQNGKRLHWAMHHSTTSMPVTIR